MRKNINKYKIARKLRKCGWSYNEINKKTGIAKSTLSGWLKDINLTKKQKIVLRKKWENGLRLARKCAAETHLRKTKEKNNFAISNAKEFIDRFEKEIFNKKLLKLFLVGLYLGEGAKNGGSVCLANANPEICLSFIELLRKNYNIEESKFRCHLHLRADQNSKRMIEYWSKLLNISENKFHKSQIDNRTKGVPTKNGYNGVCAIYYYNINIQRDLLAFNKVLIKKILGAISSVG